MPWRAEAPPSRGATRPARQLRWVPPFSWRNLSDAAAGLFYLCWAAAISFNTSLLISFGAQLRLNIEGGGGSGSGLAFFHMMYGLHIEVIWYVCKSHSCLAERLTHPPTPPTFSVNLRWKLNLEKSQFQNSFDVWNILPLSRKKPGSGPGLIRGAEQTLHIILGSLGSEVSVLRQRRR